MPYPVVAYETRSGRSPVREYIKAAPKRDVKIITGILHVLENNGFELLHTRRMEKIDELYCLRMQGEQFHRVILGYIDTDGFVLLHAFPKQTNRIPPRELNLARERMDQWLASKRREKAR